MGNSSKKVKKHEKDDQHMASVQSLRMVQILTTGYIRKIKKSLNNVIIPKIIHQLISNYYHPSLILFLLTSKPLHPFGIFIADVTDIHNKIKLNWKCNLYEYHSSLDKINKLTTEIDKH